MRIGTVATATLLTTVHKLPPGLSSTPFPSDPKGPEDVNVSVVPYAETWGCTISTLINPQDLKSLCMPHKHPPPSHVYSSLSMLSNVAELKVGAGKQSPLRSVVIR